LPRNSPPDGDLPVPRSSRMRSRISASVGREADDESPRPRPGPREAFAPGPPREPSPADRAESSRRGRSPRVSASDDRCEAELLGDLGPAGTSGVAPDSASDLGAVGAAGRERLGTSEIADRPSVRVGEPVEDAAPGTVLAVSLRAAPVDAFEAASRSRPRTSESEGRFDEFDEAVGPADSGVALPIERRPLVERSSEGAPAMGFGRPVLEPVVLDRSAGSDRKRETSEPLRPVTAGWLRPTRGGLIEEVEEPGLGISEIRGFEAELLGALRLKLGDDRNDPILGPREVAAAGGELLGALRLTLGALGDDRDDPRLRPREVVILDDELFGALRLKLGALGDDRDDPALGPREVVILDDELLGALRLKLGVLRDDRDDPALGPREVERLDGPSERRIDGPRDSTDPRPADDAPNDLRDELSAACAAAQATPKTMTTAASADAVPAAIRTLCARE